MILSFFSNSLIVLVQILLKSFLRKAIHLMELFIKPMLIFRIWTYTLASAKQLMNRWWLRFQFWDRVSTLAWIYWENLCWNVSFLFSPFCPIANLSCFRTFQMDPASTSPKKYISTETSVLQIILINPRRVIVSQFNHSSACGDFALRPILWDSFRPWHAPSVLFNRSFAE